jgi:hypothetical protein
MQNWFLCQIHLPFQMWNLFLHLGKGDLMTSCYACKYCGRNYQEGVITFIKRVEMVDG